MALMSTGLLSNAVDETVTEVTFATLFEQAMLWPILYSLRPSAGPRETAGSFSELPYLALKNEGAEATEGNITQQFKKTFSHQVYALVLRITKEMIRDEEWGLINDIGMQLGQKGAETFEYWGADLFNNITDAGSYTAEDGLAIASGAHVNAAGGNSQSNSGTNSLTHPGVKTTRTAMKNFTGYDANQVLAVSPDEIICVNDLEEDAWVVLNSVLKPDTAENNANLFANRFRLYVHPFMTGTTRWCMMDSRRRMQNLRWYQRVGLEIESDASFSQGVRKIGASTRFAFGCTDWRWVYRNN